MGQGWEFSYIGMTLKAENVDAEKSSEDLHC
jgi:hypothetical protein